MQARLQLDDLDATPAIDLRRHICRRHKDNWRRHSGPSIAPCRPTPRPLGRCGHRAIRGRAIRAIAVLQGRAGSGPIGHGDHQAELIHAQPGSRASLSVPQTIRGLPDWIGKLGRSCNTLFTIRCKENWSVFRDPVENCQHTHYLPSQTSSQTHKFNHLPARCIFLHRGGLTDFYRRGSGGVVERGIPDSKGDRQKKKKKKHKSTRFLRLRISKFSSSFFFFFCLLLNNNAPPATWPISSFWRKLTPWQGVWRTGHIPPRHGGRPRPVRRLSAAWRAGSAASASAWNRRSSWPPWVEPEPGKAR